MRAVELGGNMRGQFAGFQRGRREFGIGCGGKKIATEAQKNRTRPSRIALTVFTVSKPSSREARTRTRAEAVEERLPHALRDPHGSISLDVAMAADRTGSGSGTSDISLEKEKIHDFLDRRDRVSMFREPHLPSSR